MEEQNTDEVQDEEVLIEQPDDEQVEEEQEDDVEEVVEEEILEPQVRKSAKDFIIERKEKKIEQLQQQQQQAPQETESDYARNLIREEMAQVIEPLTSAFKSQEDERELQDVFSKNPDAKKFEGTIRKYAASPAYAQVPLDFIVKGIIGAKVNTAAKEVANSTAKRTRQGGSSRRPTEIKEKTAWDLSDADFDKEVAKQLNQNR